LQNLPGVKNFGFIEKAFDIANNNTDYMPPFLDIQKMHYDLAELEEVRQLSMVLEKFLQTADDCMLIKSDKCYRKALRVYGSLKEEARSKVPGAAALFEALQAFFKKHRRRVDGEPSTKELERDFSKLLHGKAGGGIEIVNEAPKATGGGRRVVDKVHKGKRVVKKLRVAKSTGEVID
jgi:hypothetical protein